MSPVDRALWPPSPDPTLGLALLPLDEFRLLVYMRNFSPVSEMKKGQRSWWRVLAPNSRNKAETWRITKIITFAPIIASATLKTVSLQLNGMLMMCKIQQAIQDDTIQTARVHPAFILVTGLKFSYGKISSPLTEISGTEPARPLIWTHRRLNKGLIYR